MYAPKYLNIIKEFSKKRIDVLNFKNNMHIIEYEKHNKNCVKYLREFK